MTKQSQVMDKQFYVYIMANDSNTVTYTGVTGNIKRRVFEHKEKFLEGFTQRYNIDTNRIQKRQSNVRRLIIFRSP